MNKIFVLFYFALFLCSCGSIKISPQGCKTNDGVWSNKVSLEEVRLSKEYTVFMNDQEIRLKNFLQDHKIDCSDVKKIRLEIEQNYFIKRKVTFFIEK